MYVSILTLIIQPCIDERPISSSPITETLAPGAWKFYTSAASVSMYDAEIVIGGVTQLLTLAAKVGDFPTQYSFSQSLNCGVEQGTCTLYLANLNAQLGVGVYNLGTNSTTYTISMNRLFPCPNSCSNQGNCSNRVCTCNPNFVPPDCSVCMYHIIS